MSTFTTTPATTTPAYEVTVRIKQALESRYKCGEDTAALAVFKELKHAANHYYHVASGRDYVIGLSVWAEMYRVKVEHCMNYLIAYSDEYWNDSYEVLYPTIASLMDDHLVASRLRKLALLRSVYAAPTYL